MAGTGEHGNMGREQGGTGEREGDKRKQPLGVEIKGTGGGDRLQGNRERGTGGEQIRETNL